MRQSRCYDGLTLFGGTSWNTEDCKSVFNRYAHSAGPSWMLRYFDTWVLPDGRINCFSPSTWVLQDDMTVCSIFGYFLENRELEKVTLGEFHETV